MRYILQHLGTAPNGTFFNLPLFDKQTYYDIIFLGIPLNFGGLSKKSHAGLGVSALRSTSQAFPSIQLDDSTSQGWYDYDQSKTLLHGKKLCDAGDILVENFDAIKAVNEIPKIVNYLLTRCRKLFIIGGDHSITYWTSQGIKGSDMVIFDAHEDAISIYGKFPNHSNFVSYLDKSTHVKRIFQVGLRGIVPNRRKPVPKKRTIIRTEKQLNQVIAGSANPVHVSIDWDVIDPSFLPNVSSPMPGGWNLTELVDKIRLVKSLLPDIRVVECVEFSPKPGDIPTESLSLVFSLLRIGDNLF